MGVIARGQITIHLSEKGEPGLTGNWTSYVFRSSATQPAKPTGTKPLPIDWVEAPTSTGVWWMSKAVVNGSSGLAGAWSVPIRITGIDGQQGLQGLQGPKGEQGITGPSGSNGQTSYFHIKYAPVQNPTSSQMSETPNTFIGTYVDFVQADSNDPSKYVWSRFEGMQGATGEKGIPGVNGADGRTSYLHIKYSDNGTSFTSNNGETPGAWIGQYTDYTEADSMTFSRYAWSKIKGEDGQPIIGKMLHRDPEFREGVNGCAVYDVPNNGNVTLSRIVRPSDCPTQSTHCLQISTIGPANPGHGGYYQSNYSRANGVFVSRIIAKIPIGYTMYNAHNAYGDGGHTEALTSMNGTGRYEVYMWKVVCGASGSFGTINHYYLAGGSAPVTWYVASSTTYDTTESDIIPSPEKIVTSINETADGVTISAEKITLISKMLEFGKFAVDDNGNATMQGLRAIDAIIDNTTTNNVLKCGVLRVSNKEPDSFVDKSINYRYLATTKSGQLYASFTIHKPPSVAMSESRIDVTYGLELPYTATVYFALDIPMPSNWSITVRPYVAKKDGTHLDTPIVYSSLVHTDTNTKRRYVLKKFPAFYWAGGKKEFTCIGFQYTISAPSYASAVSTTITPKFTYDYLYPQVSSAVAMYKSLDEVIIDDKGTRVQYEDAAVLVTKNQVVLDCFDQYSGSIELKIHDVSLVLNKTRLAKLKQLLG